MRKVKRKITPFRRGVRLRTRRESADLLKKDLRELSRFSPSSGRRRSVRRRSGRRRTTTGRARMRSTLKKKGRCKTGLRNRRSGTGRNKSFGAGRARSSAARSISKRRKDSGENRNNCVS
jgi:hypothetical protein